MINEFINKTAKTRVQGKGRVRPTPYKKPGGDENGMMNYTFSKSVSPSYLTSRPAKSNPRAREEGWRQIWGSETK